MISIMSMMSVNAIDIISDVFAYRFMNRLRDSEEEQKVLEYLSTHWRNPLEVQRVYWLLKRPDRVEDSKKNNNKQTKNKKKDIQ